VTDDQLIDEALAGQSASFGTLVTRYQDRLYNTLVHVLGSAEDARDIAQDAFVQAFVKLDTFQRSSAFYTWLYRIAFNLAISHQRRKRPCQSIDHHRELTGDEPVSSDHLPEQPLELEERARQVRAALDGLAEEFRTVIVLRELEDLDYQQIAAILDVPVGTVRSRLHRARQQLKEQLKEVVQEDQA
jgi:RNA polymerase sigma-70 factor (ECF subfamily)